jgi:hypothetical protein
MAVEIGDRVANIRNRAGYLLARSDILAEEKSEIVMTALVAASSLMLSSAVISLISNVFGSNSGRRPFPHMRDLVEDKTRKVLGEP